MAKEAFVQGLYMLSSAREPRGDGRLSKAEDPLCGRWVEPFGQRREHHGDLLRGGFQTIQGSVAPGSERSAAGLAAKRLNPLGMTMLAIANESVDLGIGDPAIGALLVGTGKTRGVHALGGSPAAFPLMPGAYMDRSWPSNRLRNGGEAAGRAIIWSAGLRRRWSVLPLVPPREEEDRRGNQQRCQSSASERRGPNTSRNMDT
jgi:hypothetical protein